VAQIVTITGVKDLIDNLARLDKGMKKELRRTIVAMADKKLLEMKRRCPFETGALYATGRFTVRAGAKQLIVKFHFGDSKVKYAAVQHEDLEAKHKVGRSKYVESVIRETSFAAELAKGFDLGAAARG
jgi:hypothetical protein